MGARSWKLDVLPDGEALAIFEIAVKANKS